MTLIAFFLIAAICVVASLVMVTHANPVRSALALIVVFLGLAVLYLMLDAVMVATFQVLVYAGAIMVLFLFVIMLLNLGGELRVQDPLPAQKPLSVVFGLLMLGTLVWAIWSTRFPAPQRLTVAGAPAPRAVLTQGEIPPPPPPPGVDMPAEAVAPPKAADLAEDFSSPRAVSVRMFTHWLYPFEATSVLLVVAIIGVVVLAKRRL
jgi:NADH-quinone oxidoreductase subunit J